VRSHWDWFGLGWLLALTGLGWHLLVRAHPDAFPPDWGPFGSAVFAGLAFGCAVRGLLAYYWFDDTKGR